MIRVGLGEDIHVLVEGRPLMLCGLEIPYEKGLLGHSDGDAALHAIADALLGAIGKGDIGALFPPSDPTIRGIDSAKILQKAYEEVKNAGYSLVNLDVNIVTEEPKLRPYIDLMKARLAQILGVDVTCVSVKAKTNEGCDAVGEKKAIRANAAVLIEKGR